MATIGSFGGPVSQFQNLSKQVSRTSSRARMKSFDKPKMSPREEIYKSMLREIKSGDIPQMDSLIHKASGILRLSHHNKINKGRKVSVSWDMDGRRILTYEDKSGTEKSMLQRQTSYKKSSKSSLVAALNEPIFGLDSNSLKTLSKFYDSNNNNMETSTCKASIGEFPHKIVSKVWDDYIESGDGSMLWESKEGILSEESAISSSLPSSVVSRQPSSIGSLGIKSLVTMNGETRPPWKTFYRVPSSSLIPSSIESTTSNSISASVPSMTHTKHEKGDRAEKKSQSAYSFQDKVQRQAGKKEKVDRIQYICVVNGSVVCFKNFGFENFTNWFGDDATLEANRKRCQPKVHLELDLIDVKNSDIKIRLLGGQKIEVDAMRCLSGLSKPIRIKDYLVIPSGYRAEELLMCRTKTGKLIVEEITLEPVGVKRDISTLKKSKSKAKWRISRK